MLTPTGGGGDGSGESDGDNGAEGSARDAIRFKKTRVLTDQKNVCIYLRVVFHHKCRTNQLLFEVNGRAYGCGCSRCCIGVRRIRAKPS